MPATTVDRFDRDDVLERLGRADRVPGLPSTQEMVRQLLERGSRPVDARQIRQIARMRAARPRPTRSRRPLPPSDWIGSAFVDPNPGLGNHPAPDGPPTSAGGSETHPCAPDVLRRLVDRTTFGFSWSEYDYARINGYEAYLDWQLDPDSIDDGVLDGRLASEFETLNETPRQHLMRAYNGDYLMTYELLFATILRQTISRRQLYERVVEFWSDHFNIYLFKDGSEYLKPIDDRDVIRPHALGRFSDMVKASAHSPAMLAYLDQAFSFVWSPNENYARELMELHTVGVDNFTQQDVQEVARCFTGWSIDYDLNSPTLGEFKFQRLWHDQLPKTVLGTPIRAGGGSTDGEQVIDILCHGAGAPFTARFIGRKMAVRFWGENPPEALVEEIAQAYLNTGGDIKTMLRVVLSQRWLMCAPPRFKRPYHLALSTVRALPTDLNGYFSLIYFMDLMGQVPFYWSPPDGYPESAAYWSGHILPRWRFGFSMVWEQNEVVIDYRPFLQDTPEEVTDVIDAYLFGGAMGGSVRTELLKFLEGGPLNSQRIREAIGLAIASPAFQQY